MSLRSELNLECIIPWFSMLTFPFLLKSTVELFLLGKGLLSILRLTMRL